MDPPGLELIEIEHFEFMFVVTINVRLFAVQQRAFEVSAGLLFKRISW